MRFLFISTLNFATNPRLVKEVRLALQQGYEVEVICFEFDNWSFDFNQQIKEELKGVRLHIIPANRKPFLPWAISVFWEQFFRVAGSVILLKGRMLSQSVSRRSRLLLAKQKEIRGKFDWVIGHNPGALYATYIAGKRLNCKTGFDVEDYHPGEGDNLQIQKFTRKLMDHYLPLMDYVTFAAPLMREKHAKDIGETGKNWKVILNLFPKNQFEFYNSEEDEKLQIVWFSQNVNYKRGLEEWIPALKYFADEIELTLIGNKKEPFYSEVVEGNPFIKYVEPMEQTALNKMICTYDIGLAIEGGKDYNNIIALSNKLITYFQAGLYILATHTPAQKDFLKTYPHSGLILSPGHEEFVDKLSQVIASKDSIRRTKAERFRNASQWNWENESEKLLKIWEG